MGKSLILTVLLGVGAAEPTILDLWPSGVPKPANLKSYKREQYAQRLSITNGHDQLRVNYESEKDIFLNGNILYPWAVSGGMHSVEGRWTALKGLSIPNGRSIRWWKERTEAGARRPLPRLAWQYPEGTVAADLLLHEGKPFELRTLTKGANGWKGAAVWQSGVVPQGYYGAQLKCMECHSAPGRWERYGTLIRGADGLFSPPVLRPGSRVIDWTQESTAELNDSVWPLKYWED